MLTIIEELIASKGLYLDLLNPVCRKYDLTESEILVLLYLANNPKKDTATDIVEVLGLKKAVVSVSIKDLHNRGFINETYHEGNRRSIHLELTEAAADIVKEAKKVENDYYQILVDGFDEEQIKGLKSSFRRIKDNIRSYKEK